MKTLATLLLTIVSLIASAQQPMFSDEFNGSMLDTGWTVVSPNLDGLVVLTGSDELLLSASALNGGSDLTDVTNYDAPRILQAVCGNWSVETKYHVGMTNNAQAAGWCFSVDSVTAGPSLESPGYRRHGPPCGGGVDSYLLRGLTDTLLCLSASDSIIWSRLERHDSTITQWVSFDSTQWFTRSLIDTRDIHYLGLFSVRQPYDNDTTVRTNVFLDYFRFGDMDTLQINSQEGLVVCENHPLVLSVDSIASGAYAWYGPDGGLLSDSASMTIISTTLSDSGWYHVVVSRLDCQFLTDSFLVDVDICEAVTDIGQLPSSLSIYPNPTKDQVTVVLPGDLAPGMAIRILDPMGRVVERVPPGHSRTITVPVSGLTSGAYYIVLQADQWQAHGRFIKE